MSLQLEQPKPQRIGPIPEILQCFCGQQFQGREPLDEHLKKSHTGMLVECKDCHRLFPKGNWRWTADGKVLQLVPL
jgi:hypothetical protein